MNKRRKNKKKGVRTLGCDREFLTAFLQEDPPADFKPRTEEDKKINRHGLPFVEDYETWFTQAGLAQSKGKDHPAPESVEEEDFAQLLSESFKAHPPEKKTAKPVPLKKRLKRYPPPEADLDLHGFTAIGAEARAKSFIQTALHRGYFTVRIIVGRGVHSPDGPVLPHVVEDLLKMLKGDKQVLSYEWEGGQRKKSGALKIYLNQFND